MANKSSLSWDVTILSPPWVFAVRPCPSPHPNTTATERNVQRYIQPVIHEVSTPDTLNGSSYAFYTGTVKNEFLFGRPPLSAPSHGWIDGRDVAELHVRALEVEEAGSERILIVAGQFVWQDAGEYLRVPVGAMCCIRTDEEPCFLFSPSVVDIVNSLSPSPWPSHKEPFAKGLEGKKVYNLTWITSKEKKIFGIKYRTLEETARDVLADYEKHGWS